MIRKEKRPDLLKFVPRSLASVPHGNVSFRWLWGVLSSVRAPSGWGCDPLVCTSGNSLATTSGVACGSPMFQTATPPRVRERSARKVYAKVHRRVTRKSMLVDFRFLRSADYYPAANVFVTKVLIFAKASDAIFIDVISATQLGANEIYCQ
jgi:hypothetical protein